MQCIFDITFTQPSHVVWELMLFGRRCDRPRLQSMMLEKSGFRHYTICCCYVIDLDPVLDEVKRSHGCKGTIMQRFCQEADYIYLDT